MTEEEHNEEQEMMINHKYKIWKKASPSYYQLALIHSLEWPSTTFQWLPEYDFDQNGNENHYALIASNSSEPDQSELLKVRIKVPLQSKEEAYIKDSNEKIQIIQRKVLGNQINRARYCYEKPSLIATSHSNGQILLTQKGEVVHKLVGHSSEGYGLSWNGINKNILISGQTDKRICIWDITKNRQQTNKIIPSYEILHHSTPVEDVAWHKMHPNIFASCSDDRLIMLWDMRFKNSGTNNIEGKPMFEIIAHTNEVYSLDFSPFNQFLFLSGSGDQTISVWDMRNLTHSFETFRSENSVVKVQWSPFTSTVFGTCGYDHSVNLWDLGLEKREDSQKNLFVHGGHRSKVIDFDWNKNKRMLIGSTQENNCLHIWEMAKSLYFEQLSK